MGVPMHYHYSSDICIIATYNIIYAVSIVSFAGEFPSTLTSLKVIRRNVLREHIPSKSSLIYTEIPERMRCVCGCDQCPCTTIIICSCMDVYTLIISCKHSRVSYANYMWVSQIIIPILCMRGYWSCVHIQYCVSLAGEFPSILTSLKKCFTEAHTIKIVTHLY